MKKKHNLIDNSILDKTLNLDKYEKNNEEDENQKYNYVKEEDFSTEDYLGEENIEDEGEEEEGEEEGKSFNLDNFIEKDIGVKKRVRFNKNEFLQKFKEWKISKDKKKLSELVEMLKPIWIKKIPIFGGNPKDLIDVAYTKNLVAKALHDYDPNQTNINVYLWYRLSNLPRQIHKVHNVLNYTEQDLQIKNKLDVIENEMAEELGRAPSDSELAERLGISLKKLEKIRGMGSALSSSSLSLTTEDDEERGISSGVIIPELENKYKIKILDVIYNELLPEEQVFLEHYFGLRGKKQLSLAEAAKKAGISSVRAWKLSKDINQKIHRYINELNL